MHGVMIDKLKDFETNPFVSAVVINYDAGTLVAGGIVVNGPGATSN
ncbi:hypothetical protein [Borrelia persica]|nr:hypothetical protein [Borrelia persica]